jgi:hypothetical protein
MEPAVKMSPAVIPIRRLNRPFPSDRQSVASFVALMVLTFITGLVDAVSYIGFGRVFVANMTGNVVLLGFAAAGVSAYPSYALYYLSPASLSAQHLAENSGPWWQVVADAD